MNTLDYDNITLDEMVLPNLRGKIWTPESLKCSPGKGLRHPNNQSSQLLSRFSHRKAFSYFLPDKFGRTDEIAVALNLHEEERALMESLENDFSENQIDEDLTEYYEQSESPEIVESFFAFMKSIPIVDGEYDSVYSDEELDEL